MTPSVDQLVRLNELRTEVANLRRAKELREANGLRFYRPHAKQDKFHCSLATARYLRTGNRFGKSESGIAETLSHCLGGRLWYREAFDVRDGDNQVVRVHPGGKEHELVTAGIPQRPIKALLIVVDWDKAKSIFTSDEGAYETKGKIFKMLPKDCLGKVTKSRGGHIEQIEIKRPAEFGGGSSLLRIDTIESYKHNKLSGESDDWDFIHVDEPCPESMYKAHARGLMDRNGKSIFTCTPLDEMWINELFTPSRGAITQNAPNGLSFANRFMITGSIYDNPHRNSAGVAEFESTLTSEEKQCRLYGLPLAMAGLVYKEFIYDMHVLCDAPKGWSDYHLPPLNYTIRCAWDVHGARIPQALMFAATAPDGTVFIYDELFCEPLINPNAELVKRKLENRFVVARWIDPKALIVNPVTATADIIELIESTGLFFEPGSKDKVAGISATKEKLMERNVGSNLPTIFFSPHLTQTLFEFTHYLYDIEKNEPKDKDDHMMENLRRLILGDLSYIEPPDDSDYVPHVVTMSFDEDRRRIR